MVTPRALLAQRGRSNLAIIRGGVRRNLSSKAINELIAQREGRGMRRVDLLEAIRHAKGIAESGVNIRNIRRDRRPDPNRLPIARTRLSLGYSFDVEIRYRPAGGGALQSRFVTVGGANNMTPDEMLAQARRYWDEGQEAGAWQYQGQLETMIIVGGRRRG